MLVMWQFWFSATFILAVYVIIKAIVNKLRLSKHDTILRRISKVLWKMHKRILHASLVAQYAADVSDMVEKNKVTMLVEENAKRAVVLGTGDLLSGSHEFKEIPSRG